jgi:hypothetical protein
LVARLYDGHGAAIGTRSLDPVEPTNLVHLHTVLKDAARAGRISVHLIDGNGTDRGALGEVVVESGQKNE